MKNGDLRKKKVVCPGAVKLVWESDIVEGIVKPKEYREEVIHARYYEDPC
jgi:hypothetical protein